MGLVCWHLEKAKKRGLCPILDLRIISQCLKFYVQYSCCLIWGEISLDDSYYRGSEFSVCKMTTCKTCVMLTVGICSPQDSWACCLSCGRICCAQGCNGMRTAHFLLSLHPSNQLRVWSHSHFELKDIVLFLSACDFVFLWNSWYETWWMKSCSVCNKKKSPRHILLDLLWKQSCMWPPCASKPGSLDNALEFVTSVLEK